MPDKTDTDQHLPVLSGMSSTPTDEAAAPEPALDPTLSRGLMFLHQQIGDRLNEQRELTAHVYALTEALIGAGVINLRDLERRKQRTHKEMMQEMTTHWEGAQVLTDNTDKYAVNAVQIDCGSRLDLCKAACCRLHFKLSKQDLREGIVRWDVGKPYAIAQSQDGWCTHCSSEHRGCMVHEHRPLVCRQYNCRTDKRIWVDFENRIPNPALAEL